MFFFPYLCALLQHHTLTLRYKVYCNACNVNYIGALCQFLLLTYLDNSFFFNAVGTYLLYCSNPSKVKVFFNIF